MRLGNNISDRNTRLVYPAGDVYSFFLLLELFISKTARKAFGTFWENARNLCFLFVVFFPGEQKYDINTLSGN